MTKETHWDELKKAYEKRGIVLVLGAGVSKGCNLPAWEELLCRVGESCWRTNGRDMVQQMIDARMNLPVVAGILEAAGSKQRSFVEQLREALYRDFPFDRVIKTPKDRQRLVDYVHGKLPGTEDNTTMRAVAGLCTMKNTAAGKKLDPRHFIPNSKVHAVVTTNVDAILRTYIRARYGEWLLRTIEGAGHGRREGRTSTYYLHGFLKFYRQPDTDDEEEPVECVFTEQQYYDFFSRPYGVFSYTFLYLLREFSCVFIGMSMQDENIRRLLHYSITDRRAGKPVTSQTRPRHFALLPSTGSPEIDQFTALSLRRLGVRMLDVAFQDIPSRLATIYGTKEWQAVY